MEEYELQSAKDTAMTYLSYQSHTADEIRKHLKGKGYTGALISECLEFLVDAGLIDDEDYAARYIQKSQEKGRGPKRIARELQGKGISSSILQSQLEAYYDRSVEREIAREIAEKLWKDIRRKGLPGLDGNTEEDYGFDAYEDASDGCEYGSDSEYGSEESDFSEEGSPQSLAARQSSKWSRSPQKNCDQGRNLREKQLAKVARKLEYQGFGSGVVFEILKNLK